MHKYGPCKFCITQLSALMLVLEKPNQFCCTDENLFFSTNSFMVFSVVLSDVPLLKEGG